MISKLVFRNTFSRLLPVMLGGWIHRNKTKKNVLFLMVHVFRKPFNTYRIQ